MPEGKHLLHGVHFFVKIGNFGVPYLPEFVIIHGKLCNKKLSSKAFFCQNEKIRKE